MFTSKDLLQQWLKRARENSFAHYAMEEKLSNRHYWLGIPATILAGIVGTSVFAALGEQVNFKIQLAVGTISVIVAILTALQTFLRYAERADAHRRTAIKYGSVRRDIEQQLVNDGPLSQETVDRIKFSIDSIGAEAPPVPSALMTIFRARDNKVFFLSKDVH